VESGQNIAHTWFALINLLSSGVLRSRLLNRVRSVQSPVSAMEPVTGQTTSRQPPPFMRPWKLPIIDNNAAADLPRSRPTGCPARMKLIRLDQAI